MSERFKCPLAVHLIFIKDNRVLLQKRKNCSFSGMFSLPGGHIDGNERIISGAIREAEEEIGLKLKHKDLKLGTIFHTNYGNNEYIQFYYICRNWDGEIINKEPERCERLEFFELDNLPEETLPIIKIGIHNALNNISFAEEEFPFY